MLRARERTTSASCCDDREEGCSCRQKQSKHTYVVPGVSSRHRKLEHCPVAPTNAPLGRWLLGAIATACLAIACGSKGAASESTACDDCTLITDAASATTFWASVPQCLSAVTTLENTNPYLYTAKWSPVADFVLTGTTGALRLIQVDTMAGTLNQVVSFTQPGNIYVDWDKSGQLALSAGTDVRLLGIGVSPPSVTELASFQANTSQLQLYDVKWSPDNQFALTAGEDGAVRLLQVDVATPALTQTAVFTGHVGKVFGVTWAPDGQHALSVGEDKTLRLLAVDTNAGSISELASAQDFEWESAVAWGSADTPVLSGTWGIRNAVQLWSVPADFSALDRTLEIPGQTPGVQVLEWSWDRTQLITAEHEDTLHLFTRNGMSITAIGTLGSHYTGVHAVAWSPDGNSLVVASSHGDILTLVDVRGCNPSPAE
jgi:WD40 repeat protein